MRPRFFIGDLAARPQPLPAGEVLALPTGPVRHAQVLRLQPGDELTLFDGRGGEWRATVVTMGRGRVDVRLVAHDPVERELPLAVTLAVGMPANERMDALVEKATELGAAAIQPLVCDRSVLRLAGDRADKKVAHWQAVAVSACEQSGRTRVPVIAPVRTLDAWMSAWLPRPGAEAIASPRWLLSLDASAVSAAAAVSAEIAAAAIRAPTAAAAAHTPTAAVAARSAIVCLSGPEGGLSPAEQAAAHAAGFTAVSLGPRVLRADTAPLALLAHLGVSSDPSSE